jgi:outer membrane translocation and assembly module TamA
MSFDKVAVLAEQFVIKIAEHQYAETAPKDVKAEDLDWIDEKTRREIQENGKKEEYKPFDKSHNPPGAIASEKTWDRAKKAVKPYWKKYEEPWATVFHVYKMMGGKVKKSKKK